MSDSVGEQGRGARALAAVAVGAGAAPDLACLRTRGGGGVARVAFLGGDAQAWPRWEDAPGDVRVRSVAPPAVAMTEVVVRDCVSGALLVCWQASELESRLAVLHPAPPALLAGAAGRLELATIAELLGAVDDTGVPSRALLARSLGIDVPGGEAREEALFFVRAARRLATGGAWMARVFALSPDERAIVRLSVRRLETGRTVYGPWAVSDGRDYQRESLEEVVDALHYAAARLIEREAAAPSRGGR